MHREQKDSSQKYLEFVGRNFGILRRAAVEDISSYSSGWAIYSVRFLNAVAEIQGSPSRIDNDVIISIRQDRKRFRNPRIAELIGEARHVHAMKIELIMALIHEEVAEVRAKIDSRDERWSQLYAKRA